MSYGCLDFMPLTDHCGRAWILPSGAFLDTGRLLGQGSLNSAILVSRRPPTNPTITAENGLLSASRNQGIERTLTLSL